MARTFEWRRSITGISVLTTTTQFLALSAGDLPDFTTVTRMVGNAMFDYAPDRDPASSAAALIAAGIGTFSVPSAVDVALPNQFAVGWLWWRYQVVRTGFYGTYVDGLTPGTFNADFDVSGQRQIDSFSQTRLYFWSRLVSPIVGVGVTPTASIRLGVSVLYNLPEA